LTASFASSQMQEFFCQLDSLPGVLCVAVGPYLISKFGIDRGTPDHDLDTVAQPSAFQCLDNFFHFRHRGGKQGGKSENVRL